MGIDLRSACVSQFKMNDNAASTVVTDSQGFSNGTAQANTNTLHTTGKINGALTFNGTDDYVDTHTGFHLTFADSFSISFWCKPDDGRPSNRQGLFGDGGSEEKLGFLLDTGGTITFGYQTISDESFPNIGITSSLAFADGQEIWHFVVGIVYKVSDSSARSNLYIDTVLVGDSGEITPVTMSIFVDELNCLIGNLANDGLFDPFTVYEGDIDNVCIFNKALSADEIAFLYNGGAGTEELYEQADSGEGAIMGDIFDEMWSF